MNTESLKKLIYTADTNQDNSE